MVIDGCHAFVLDDVRLDMPSLEQVEREIDLAQSYSSLSRGRPIYAHQTGPIREIPFMKWRVAIISALVFIRFSTVPSWICGFMMRPRIAYTLHVWLIH